MSLKRVVIPLRDVKFMLDDEVSSLFSKMPPNIGDSKIKELKNHEDMNSEEDNKKIEQDNEDPQTNRSARKSKRSAEKPKYDTEEPQEKRGGKISKRSSEKSKHVNTNENILSDDDITIIASVEFPKKRGGRKSIRSVENLKRYSEKIQAKKYGRRSKRSSAKPDYEESKKDNSTDEDSKQDSEEPQTKRYGKRSKRTAGKPKYEESKEDNITDEDSKVTEERKKDNSTNEDSKQSSEEPQTQRYGRKSKQTAGKPKYEESKEDNITDEDSKVTEERKKDNSTNEDSKEERKKDNSTNEDSKEESKEDNITDEDSKVTEEGKEVNTPDEGSEWDSDESLAKRDEKKSKLSSGKPKFDSDEELKSTKDATRSTQRKKCKKVEFEDSESDECTKNSKKIKFGEDSESDADEKNCKNIKFDDGNESDANRKKSKKIKFDEGSESDESEFGENRKNSKKIEVDDDSESDGDTKKIDEYESEEGTTSSDDTNSKGNVTEEELSFDEETTTTEESSSQYSSDESSSSSEKSDTLQKKRKESFAQKRKKDPLSEYEKRIEEKRSEKLKFLKSIKIDEVKEDLKEVVKKVKKKKKKSERHTSDDELLEPVRRSGRNVIISEPRSKRRVREKEFNYSEDALYEKVVEEALSQKVEKEKVVKEKGTKVAINRELMPVEMSFEEALELDGFYKYYVVDIKVQESKPESNFIYDKSVLEKLGLNPPRDGSFKLERDPAAHVATTAFTWYPSSENLILAAGCSTGTLSFWNVNTGTDPYIFKNHLQGITHLQFNPFNRNQIISSSLDGTMRCGDMMKKVFNELYASTEYMCCQYFDFLSDSSYIVAQNKGLVAIVDHRTDGKRSEKEYLCHDCTNCVKSVNVHPVNKSYFVTANTNGCVRLWDLRKMQEHPVAHIQRQDQGTQFAFFSPVTGNSILASTKFCFSLYDSTNLTENIRLRKEKRQKQYRNLKGPVKATWLPNSEEAFYISSNADPRGIIVYDTKFNVFHKIAHTAFTTATTPISLFHPFRPAVAVGKRHCGLVFSTDVSSST